VRPTRACPEAARPADRKERSCRNHLFDVKAQISGIFYRTASPDAPAFVEVGAAVRKGQTLALLESMKLFSKVKSPADGFVVEVTAENEAAVSVGQVLVRLKRV
jgi:acetyl-CoA carboxylase biotin carboxyl carrier protein